MINFICLCVFHIFANYSQNFRIHGLWSQRDISSLFLLQSSVYFAADGRKTPNTYHVLLSYIVSNLIKRLEFNLILNRERYFVLFTCTWLSPLLSHYLARGALVFNSGCLAEAACLIWQSPSSLHTSRSSHAVSCAALASTFSLTNQVQKVSLNEPMKCI